METFSSFYAKQQCFGEGESQTDVKSICEKSYDVKMKVKVFIEVFPPVQLEDTSFLAIYKCIIGFSPSEKKKVETLPDLAEGKKTMSSTNLQRYSIITIIIIIIIMSSMIIVIISTSQMLPLPGAITSQLDKASIVRLTIAYLRSAHHHPHDDDDDADDDADAYDDDDDADYGDPDDDE